VTGSSILSRFLLQAALLQQPGGRIVFKEAQ
jgi:hypothetical protein